MKKRIILTTISLLIVALLLVPACVPKRTTDTTNPNTASDTERITALETKVSQLQSKIASLPASDSKDFSGDIEKIYGEIDDLQAQLDDILGNVDAMLADWEKEQQSSNEVSTEGVTTRWTPSIALETESTALYVDQDSITWRPTRIKDEDTYRIEFIVVNKGASAKPTLVVVFTPSSKDTSVDVTNTGAYSINPISIGWDSEFNPSNGVDCKRIEFVSDQFVIQAGTPDTPFIKEVSIDFDLYYAK